MCLWTSKHTLPNIQVSISKIMYRSIFDLFFRSKKPGAGLGWTEPRSEAFIGLVDKRKMLKGYIGGVKNRESKFFQK